VKLLSEIFQIKDSLGNIYPYIPQPYQVEWHRHFFLVDPNSPNRLWTKGRGLGATAITMMDLLMLGTTYRNLKIPIASITGRQVEMSPIDWGRWLCDNTRIPGAIPRNPEVDSQIELLKTGSIIFTIPGGNPNALRTYRCPVVFYDEFDWCEYPKALLDAGNRCMSEGGQATIVSTIQNIRGEFQRLIDHSKELDYWVLRTPVFPVEGLDLSKSLLLQSLKPIAPWINMKKLDDERKRDLQVFLRENQCVAPDVSANFLDWGLISKICTITNYRGDSSTRWTKDSREPYNTSIFNLGVDYARNRDLSAFEVFELTAFGWIQVYEKTLRGSDTKAQNEFLDLLEDKFILTNIRIDMTGPGQGFYDYARSKHGSKVDGIHFAEKITVEDEKAPVKNVFANNLRTQAQDGKLKMFDYLELKEDLNSIPYDLSDSKRTEEGSHGDRFWASALAIWNPRTFGSPVWTMI
jgi:hypothetical protein